MRDDTRIRLCPRCGFPLSFEPDQVRFFTWPPDEGWCEHCGWGLQ
jgi:ribosomal protein L37E